MLLGTPKCRARWMMFFVITRKAKCAKAATTMFTFVRTTLNAFSMLMRPAFSRFIRPFLVIGQMIGDIHYFQILYTIICVITVDMMYNLFRIKLTFKMLFHKPTMVINLLASH